MEDIVRFRVKHYSKNNSSLNDVRNKLDLRRLDLRQLLEPYCKVVGLHFNTPFSAYLRVNSKDEAYAVKAAFNGKQARHLGKSDYQGRLQVDIVKRDTFSRVANKQHSGPQGATRRDSYADVVPGLVILKEFITEDEERLLLDQINKPSNDSWWENVTTQELKNSTSQPSRRRVQHFGYKFDYNTRHADLSNEVPWPEWVHRNNLLERINVAVSEAVGIAEFHWKADQATVNEYVPGEGIAKHVDTHSAFEDGIASLSLGSDAILRFARCDSTGAESSYTDAVIPRRSLFIMTRDSRYIFTHAMPQRMTDKVDGILKCRGTRVSITFRQIKHTPCNCTCNEFIKSNYC